MICLVVAYVSLLGVPSITLYEQKSMSVCNDNATKIYSKVTSGTARVWCKRLPKCGVPTSVSPEPEKAVPFSVPSFG